MFIHVYLRVRVIGQFVNRCFPVYCTVQRLTRGGA